jgi:hypothetical protein
MLPDGENVINLQSRSYPPARPRSAEISIPTSLAKPKDARLSFLLKKYNSYESWPVKFRLYDGSMPPDPFADRPHVHRFCIEAECLENPNSGPISAQIDQMVDELFKLRTGYWMVTADLNVAIDPKALKEPFSRHDLEVKS